MKKLSIYDYLALIVIGFCVLAGTAANPFYFLIVALITFPFNSPDFLVFPLLFLPTIISIVVYYNKIKNGELL